MKRPLKSKGNVQYFVRALIKYLMMPLALVHYRNKTATKPYLYEQSRTVDHDCNTLCR